VTPCSFEESGGRKLLQNVGTHLPQDTASYPKTHSISETCLPLAQNEDRHDLHSSKYYKGDHIKNNEMDRACGRWGNLKESDHFKDIDADGRIILKLILGGRGLDSYSSRFGQVVDFCECDSELSGSINCGEFLD
jgi:hypothetical protein